MTAQLHEALILDGMPTSMTSVPRLPHPHKRLVRAEQLLNDITRSTACWRGYVGSWEIKDERLWLISLIGAWHLKEQEPLWAEWFSGVLRIPTGALLEYVHQGFSSVYSGELLITVENGRVVRRQCIEHRPQIVGRLRFNSKTESAVGDVLLFPGVNPLDYLEDKGIVVIAEFAGNLPEVIYDDRQSKFFVRGATPSNAIRLNGAPLLFLKELNEDDELQIGEASLRLVISHHDNSIKPVNHSK